MEKLISESAFYEAIYKLPIREKKADGCGSDAVVEVNQRKADIYEVKE